MTLRAFYGHHHESIDPHDVPVSKLLNLIRTFLPRLRMGLHFTSSGLLRTEHNLFLNMTDLLSVNSHSYKTCLGICSSNIYVFIL